MACTTQVQVNWSDHRIAYNKSKLVRSGLALSYYIVSWFRHVKPYLQWSMSLPRAPNTTEPISMPPPCFIWNFFMPKNSYSSFTATGAYISKYIYYISSWGSIRPALYSFLLYNPKLKIFLLKLTKKLLSFSFFSRFPCFLCFFAYLLLCHPKKKEKLEDFANMAQQNTPPRRRGQIKINIIKGFFRSAAKILSIDSGIRRRRTKDTGGGGLSSSSTTPGTATPYEYNSDAWLDPIQFIFSLWFWGVFLSYLCIGSCLFKVSHLWSSYYFIFFPPSTGGFLVFAYCPGCTIEGVADLGSCCSTPRPWSRDFQICQRNMILFHLRIYLSNKIIYLWVFG